MAYTSYDAKDFTIVIDDVNITGLGEDMATGEKDEELNSFSVGAQGDVVENKINNTLGSLSVTVQRTCPQMSFLRGLANRTEPFPAWVTNKKLKERFGGSMAKLKSLPEAGAGSEAEDVTFEFQVIDYTSESI